MLEVARLLLNHGIGKEAENIDGNSPFRVASASGHDELARLLTERGCQMQDVDVTQVMRGTPQVIEG